jgi:hypothetical protein
MQPFAIDSARVRLLAEVASGLVHAVKVINDSERPIRNVASLLEGIKVGNVLKDSVLAQVHGQFEVTVSPFAHGPTLREVRSVERGDHLSLLRSGKTALFMWPLTIAHYPTVLFTARFTDADDNHWQIDNDLRLHTLDSRDW